MDKDIYNLYRTICDKGKLIYKIGSLHDIAEILLELALNINQSINQCFFAHLHVDTNFTNI